MKGVGSAPPPIPIGRKARSTPGERETGRELIQGAEGLTCGRSFQNSVLMEEEEGVSLRDPLWTCAEAEGLREQGLLQELRVWGILVWGRRGGGRGRGKHLPACTDSRFCYQDGRSGWSVRHCKSPRGPSLSAFLISPCL